MFVIREFHGDIFEDEGKENVTTGLNKREKMIIELFAWLLSKLLKIFIFSVNNRKQHRNFQRDKGFFSDQLVVYFDSIWCCLLFNVKLFSYLCSYIMVHLVAICFMDVIFIITCLGHHGLRAVLRAPTWSTWCFFCLVSKQNFNQKLGLCIHAVVGR